ncbi:hypothetical protein GCM10009555_001340 [Acrocarpospora macrocephala]|uniref:HTH gntR-type domain-containing protein n=1 Tax=Acrocarpospora macrocephala TaxID=150177 RepID=A0A5M3X0G2_9ACTN|nr:winged helix-turn-helix domain-containing protein [Acrocarpospora macrocephala]GES15227.1 hypothetical protein Amac_088240 [Acrocarpospora macrocephala]
MTDARWRPLFISSRRIELDREGPDPLYRQIAHILRDQIQSREFKEGDMLPSEDELMKRFEVSRRTVNKAVKILRKEALVTFSPGYGTVVGRWLSFPPLLPSQANCPYRTIADEVISKIRDGTYLPLEALPGIKHLTRTYGASRTTIRRTLALLRDLGWIYSVQGKGSFVEHEDNWPGQ